MKRLWKLSTVALAMSLLLALTVTGAAVAQGEEPFPCFDEAGTPGSCMAVVLAPETLVGEAWVDDQMLEFEPPGKVNYVWFFLTESGVSGKFEFRAIEDPNDPNFNLLYVYSDVSKTITSPALGTWRTYTLTATKKYIRQAVELACNVKNWVDEDVSCLVNIDGVDMPDLILAGQKDTYALDPGPHTIILTLTGNPEQVVLWSPSSVTKKMNAFASANVSKQAFNFSKAGHLIANMDQPGALADWYVDGELVAEQAASIDGWVNPTKSHKVEIKNINDDTMDSASAFRFHWKDANQFPFVGSGLTKTITFKLLKEGNWALPFEYAVPKGSLVEGPHTYNLSGACASDPESPFNSEPVTFNVDPAAALVYPAVYLRLRGILATKVGGEDFLLAVNPQQVLKALVTYSSRDKTEVEPLATDCTLSITLDGVPFPLTPGAIYRLTP